VAVCIVEEVLLVFVLQVDVVVDDTDVVCLVDLTERWIDCLLLLPAIEDDVEVGEEVAVLHFVIVLVHDDTARVDLDLESLLLADFVISLSFFFDLYCRVDLLDCLVVVVATISVDGCLTLL